MRSHVIALLGMTTLACGGRESTSTGGNAGTDATGGGSTGSGASAGSGGATAAGGMGGSAGAGGSSGGGATAGAGGTDGGASCGGKACGLGLQCCDNTCVNPNNDINNCGVCGNVCPRPNPFCDNGRCGKPPCDGMTCTGGGLCCGSACCTDGQLCCNIQGPGPSVLRCTAPMNDTCPPGCPACICASPATSIATPAGPRPIAALREGDLVYSVDHGRVAAVPVQQTKRVAVDHHVVVRVMLANGSTLEISAPHPTADARHFGDLHAGDTLGGIGVLAADVVPYAHEFTYDILPASDTGTYFAGGALIGSTLAAFVDVGICIASP